MNGRGAARGRSAADDLIRVAGVHRAARGRHEGVTARLPRSGTAQALSVLAVVWARTGALITSWAGIVGALAT